VREWLWWGLPRSLRWYVATPPTVAVVVIGIAAARTDWQFGDLAKFLLLLCCGTISVISTPRMMYGTGGFNRDFSSVWVLPTAILLPPIYAALIPIPLLLTMKLFVHHGVLHRTVFTIAATSLGYAAASFVFRWFPSSLAGNHVGFGFHAFTWALAVAACEIIGGRIHHFMILGAVKISDRKVRIRNIDWNREAVQGLFVEIDLAVLITLAVALSPALVLLAVPTVLLVRRFLVFPVLMAQSRADAKTGLLNVSTWEREAEGELSRSMRMRTHFALALVDIDHFKLVNDTYGHLVGDRVLKAVADALKGQLRDYDKAGRFGGEEFVLLLAQATEDEACRIAERLRSFVGDMRVPVNDSPDAPVVGLTISIGVTALPPGHTSGLTDMLAAADSALYEAKQAGRNRVCVASRDQRVELEVGIADTVAVVEVDPAGASSGLSR
jgi:diguanylate cyclase (GGDEF)-like protein